MLGILGTRNPRPGESSGNGIQHIGLAGAIGPRQHHGPRRHRDLNGRIGAEIGEFAICYGKARHRQPGMACRLALRAAGEGTDVKIKPLKASST